ncbi:aldolase/citrate lyase family protein [Methylocella sp.]|uniref:aldolase/citrate lyase family protein n=1 Tax=Methylocella sp. TaxID=1978226 RepID=UPI003784BF86
MTPPRIRSLLRVASEDGKALERALRSGADALWLTAPDNSHAPAALRLRRRAAAPPIFVEIAPEDDAALRIAPALAWGAAGFLMARCAGSEDMRRLGARLAVAEAERGLPDGSTLIIAQVATRPAEVFDLGGFARTSPRLAALLFDPRPLTAALGAAPQEMSCNEALQAARGMTILAASSANVAAIDATWIDEASPDLLREGRLSSRRAGFSGFATACAEAVL